MELNLTDIFKHDLLAKCFPDFLLAFKRAKETNNFCGDFRCVWEVFCSITIAIFVLKLPWDLFYLAERQSKND